MDEWTHSRTCTWSQRRRLSPVRLNPSRPQVWSKSASYKMNARCGRYPLGEAYITCSETVGCQPPGFTCRMFHGSKLNEAAVVPRYWGHRRSGAIPSDPSDEDVHGPQSEARPSEAVKEVQMIASGPPHSVGEPTKAGARGPLNPSPGTSTN